MESPTGRKTVLIAGAVLLVLAGALVWAGFALSILSVAPPEGSVVAETQPYISVGFSGHPIGGGIRVDGRPVPTSVQRGEGRILAVSVPLTEGQHTFSVELRSPLGRTVRRSWRVQVDRKGPALVIETPADGLVTGQQSVTIRGRTDPGARVTLGDSDLRADQSGQFEAQVALAEGPTQVDIVAFDEAGNEARQTRQIQCDLQPPRVHLESPKADSRVKQDKPLVSATIEDNDELAQVTLTVDEGAPQAVEPDDQGRVSLPLEGLPEGRRLVVVTAQDRAGHVSRAKVEFTLDTTEHFGEKVTTRGAVGQDVVSLQKRLYSLGLLNKEGIHGEFDEHTLAGLRQCQKKHGLDPDGILGPATVAILGPRVYVNLGRFALVVEEAGQSRRYSIAHGTPEHPTPTGEFRVVDKVRDPTWIPPDSLWAKEAEITPPGPENPLGTRWLGLDSKLVGIHGTPYPATIGSRASHGCLRMRMNDVEEVFEQVGVGTRVVIFAGTEKDPVRERLWP